MWSLGDGKQVPIWGDKWIPHTTTNRIQSLVSILPENALVSYLLDFHTGWWDMNLLQ